MYHTTDQTVFPFSKFPFHLGFAEPSHLRHTSLPIQDVPEGFPSWYTVDALRPETDIGTDTGSRGRVRHDISVDVDVGIAPTVHIHITMLGSQHIATLGL